MRETKTPREDAKIGRHLVPSRWLRAWDRSRREPSFQKSLGPSSRWASCSPGSVEEDTTEGDHRERHAGGGGHDCQGEVETKDGADQGQIEQRKGGAFESGDVAPSVQAPNPTPEPRVVMDEIVDDAVERLVVVGEGHGRP
jgi:hypothetical protein